MAYFSTRSDAGLGTDFIAVIIPNTDIEHEVIFGENAADARGFEFLGGKVAICTTRESREICARCVGHWDVSRRSSGSTGSSSENTIVSRAVSEDCCGAPST